jgi:exosortase
MTSALTSDRPRSARLLVPILAPMLLALACMLWAFWSTLGELAFIWRTNDDYSHGFLVPVFALLLLWSRRERLDRAAARPSLFGLVLLGAGLALRLGGVYFHYLWLDPLSLIPCVAGVCWLLGGRAAWRWAWPAVLFLTFMIPLPYRAACALADPLQGVATNASTFLMQTFGLPALAEGHVIRLNDRQINIVEACSGLRMLMVFVALSTAIALLARRPLLDRLLLLASAIPIALVANILRVTATGVLHELTDSETANAFFHDFAGWLMPPLALAMLGLELKILSRLFIDLPAPPPRPAREQALRRLRGPKPTRAKQARPQPNRSRSRRPEPVQPPAEAPVEAPAEAATREG